MRIFLGWPGRAELRARPALFFVVEGGAGLFVRLVELGVRLEASGDADDRHEVNDGEGAEGDPGVDLYPLLVDGHAQKDRYVLSDDLDLAGPRCALCADVRGEPIEGLEWQERFTNKRSDHFEGQHGYDQIPLQETRDGEDDHRNGYRDLVSKGVEPLASGGGAGVVQVFPELTGGGLVVWIFFISQVVGGSHFAVETIQDEREDRDAEPQVVIPEEVQHVTEPRNRHAPKREPVGAQVWGLADLNESFLWDRQKRQSDDHPRDDVEDDLELSRQGLIELQHSFFPPFLNSN